MTPPTDHTVIITNRFGITITAPVTYVKDLGAGKAEVHVETNYHIEAGYAHPAIYTTPKSKAKGTYKISGHKFTERMSYVYHGVFERTVSESP